MLAVIILALLLPVLAAPAAGAADLGHKDMAEVWIYTGALIYRQTTKEELKTFAGTVTGVDQTRIRRVADPQIYLEVREQAGPVYVLLGPSEYLKQQGFAFKASDLLEGTGVRLTWRTKKQAVKLVIAHEVKIGDKVLKLRYDDGTPRWRAPAAASPNQ